MTVKADANKETWENSEFPILCETCLGDNPYVRMTRQPHGSECKICTRPFTVFRWKPGRKARHKKTEICQSCAKLKNVCQTCIFDLEYGLPVQVRDAYLSENQRMLVPESEVNKNYYTQEMERNAERMGSAYNKETHEALLRLARRTPYYKRNRPHVCSFWLKGECNRGDECPYLHEDPGHDPNLKDQNITDRFHGRDDPVANKILHRAPKVELHAPEDGNITTLWVGGITDDIQQDDIRDHFYSFGEVSNINMIRQQQCAFITYTSRSAAEEAAKRLFRNLVIKGHSLNVQWAKPQSSSGSLQAVPSGIPPPPGTTISVPLPFSVAPAPGTAPNAVILPTAPGSIPMFPQTLPAVPASTSTSSSRAYYPSMDPNAMGSRSTLT